MTDKIKIDIVSDVVCPWCIIGYKRLEKTISEMGIEDKVEIEWHPFELNSNMPKEGEDVFEHIARKYGSSYYNIKNSLANMTSLGEEVGFKFDYFDGIRVVNTKDAHVLLDYAKELGKQTELKTRLFTAFFSEQKDISDREILMREVRTVGLNVEEAKKSLESKEAHERVMIEEAKWQRKGVSSVPTIVFNSSSALTGAQPASIYKKELSELLNKIR